MYDFLAQRSGVQDAKSDNRPAAKRKPRKHRGLEKLRKRKQEMKKAWKVMKKAGLANSPAGKLLTKRWRALLRQHNQLRVAVNKQAEQRKKRSAEKAFRKDPNKFVRKLFHGPGSSATPRFSKENAQEYFSKTYRDEQRNHNYQPLPEMLLLRPGLPKKAFEMRCPTFAEFKKSARRKRNGARAGMDGISYVPWKKLPAALRKLHELGCRIWRECSTADDWAQAFIALLKKGSLLEDLDVVGEWRPISMTATAGKIFLSILSDRLQTFMVNNNYIPRRIQKGFLSGVAGCVEHTFMLYEALKEAKEHTRQIVVSWLDLANAYGSVRHNLIQFALNWYHIPKQIQELIFDYYEKLMAKIVTKEWSTGFFLFDIGLFQGCVLSAILFLCVFQLLLDLLKPLEDKAAYSFKMTTSVKILSEAFADDLSLVTRNTAMNQLAVNKTQDFLAWTETMKAKPRKCVALGLKQFDARIKHEDKIPVLDQTYSSFDPQLTIDGNPMRFILDTNKPDDFKSSHFKFLGRWIHHYLNEKQLKTRTEELFSEDVQLVNKSYVNGFMKLWLYQFYLLYRFSWPFIVHDLDLSYAKKLQTIAQPFLKRWSGVGRSVDPGVLYRSRDNYGLGLTSVSAHFTSMQLVKCQLLEASVDENVRKVFATRTEREAKLVRVFRASRLNTTVNAQTDLDLRFPSQPGRQGLGAGNFNANPTMKEKRKMVSNTAKSFIGEKHIQHAQSLAQQGVWLQWRDSTVPYDLSWKNLIHGPGPHVLKFVLNATVNWVKTPDTLKLWGYIKKAYCILCGKKQCTLHHIIAACDKALSDGRFNWRHDSVLYHLEIALRSLIEHANSLATSEDKPPVLPISASFVPAGESPSASPTRPRLRTDLDGATDWKIIVDYDHEKIVFPPEIYATSQRPDIIIWSVQSRRVILIELTCPAEEGIEAAATYKKGRYSELLDTINSERCPGWSASLKTIEVGARGFVARSTFWCFKSLGIKPRAMSKLRKELEQIASRCTYAIYLHRETSTWDRRRELLKLGALS